MFAWSGMRAPHGGLRDEVHRAAIIAALPCIALTFTLHLDGGVRWTGPEWLVVSVPLAASITSCGVLFGGAIWLRLRSPVAAGAAHE